MDLKIFHVRPSPAAIECREVQPAMPPGQILAVDHPSDSITQADRV